MNLNRKRTHSQSSNVENEIHIKQELSDDDEEVYIKEEIDDDEETATKNTSVKGKNVKRRGRIIIRNLSFKTTEDKLREHFEKFGPIEEVKLLRREDGKLVGCGFVQFKVVQNASKAMYHTTGKPFLGRPIVCDWALGKDTYLKNMQEALQKEIKQEIDPDDIKTEDEIKTELFETDTDKAEDILMDEKAVTNEDKSDNDNNVKESEKKHEEKLSDEDDSDEKTSDEDDDDEKSSDDDSEEMSEVEDSNHIVSEEEFKEPEIKRPKFVSNDVSEGKTVFIKNVPFSATNDDVKDCMSQFGELYYALVCIDPVTEHSKGTAFVKYKNVEDAEKCLAAGTELTLKGNILDCHWALNKSELQNKNQKKNKNEIKDSRNLYLVKEGVILAGSKAAEGVSAEDMAKRLDLEKWKTQMLRNLNMFVSRERLVIYNIPLFYDDTKLRQLFAKHISSKVIIKEARIMRDLKNLDNKGVGKSKEYGFVAFANHEDALTALRKINNNPNIFTKAKRPIVAFSIENRSVLNARNKRLMKSKLNNPNYKQHNKQNIIANKAKVKKNFTPIKQKIHTANSDRDFTGLTGKPGINKMRSKFKLKTQAKMHFENLKNEKKKRKAQKNLERKQRVRQPKQKQSKQEKKKETDNFSKLVSDYKRKIMANAASQKSKWYES